LIVNFIFIKPFSLKHPAFRERFVLKASPTTALPTVFPALQTHYKTPKTLYLLSVPHSFAITVLEKSNLKTYNLPTYLSIIRVSLIKLVNGCCIWQISYLPD